jgi:hypothetical protein
VQDGNCVLMTQKSTIELISDDNQQAVIGRRVKVTGVFVSPTIAKADGELDNNNTDGRTTSKERASNQNGEMAKLRVSKVKILSRSCDIKFEKKPTNLGRVYFTCKVAYIGNQSRIKYYRDRTARLHTRSDIRGQPHY